METTPQPASPPPSPAPAPTLKTLATMVVQLLKDTRAIVGYSKTLAVDVGLRLTGLRAKRRQS